MGTEISRKNVCAGKIEVPTDKEIRSLNEMRGIKTKVRDIKKRIRELTESGDNNAQARILELEKDLRGYKSQWMEWQQKHRAAVRERMIILGHEE